MQPTTETPNMNTPEAANETAVTPDAPVTAATPAAPAAAATPAVSATAATPASSELQHYGVHHSYIWLGTIRSTLAILFVLIISMFSSLISIIEDGGVFELATMGAIVGGIGLLFLLLVGVIVLVHFLAYKRLYFTLGPNEFSLYSGIITKKRVHVPYDRVQSVDARASLIQRLFGVRNVFIDTAGGAANKAVTVPYLTKAQAEWLTSELYARKRQALQPQAAQVPSAAGAVSAAPVYNQQGNVLDVGKQAWDEIGGVFADESQVPQVEMRPSFQYGLTNKQLFLAGLSNNTSFVLLIIGFISIISQIVGLASQIFPSQTDMAINSFTSQVVNPMFGFGIAISIAGIVGFLVVIWIIAAAGQCISFGGFRARRIGDRVEVERGLLQHTRQSISIQRVQAVVVKQSVIRRLIGYCEVSLDKIDTNSADDTSQNSSLNTHGVVIHPFCKLSDVPGILQGIVPEYAAVPQGRTPVAPVALRRAIIRRCIWQGGGFWLAVCTAIVQIAINLSFVSGAASSSDDIAFLNFTNAIAIGLYVIAAVVFVLEAISAVKWARESGFAVNERFMKMINGGLSREERSFPRNKIQYGFTKTNPFQRISNVATINVRTAAGVGGTSVDMKDVACEDADDWLNWLQPHPSQVQSAQPLQ
ncbi:PH domain-containing protein [Adlercreutzia sp. ZJ304]|uniref:PH domain-containing protein n=1 Tax=Adlercreutzia sp. ZJ304 TaxID=2709791 RepID=UPI001F153CD4|nr:PH domain-containing protein [Adlercreutzia sp. ZJ304]